MYCRFCCTGDVLLIEIFTLYFVINGRDVNVIIAVRDLFNDSLMMSWKAGGFEVWTSLGDTWTNNQLVRFALWVWRKIKRKGWKELDNITFCELVTAGGVRSPIKFVGGKSHISELETAVAWAYLKQRSNLV
jgi:hypothetical protein